MLKERFQIAQDFDAELPAAVLEASTDGPVEPD